jgi:hypothetical protein
VARVPVLVRHGGHANAFVGDGLLGVFGTPVRLADHADRAMAAASGPVVAGTIGGGGRVEFTVIGDVVNTVARVEEATRITGDDILLTEATRARLVDEHGGFVGRGDAELKGTSQRVRLHAPRTAAAVDRAVRLRAICNGLEVHQAGEDLLVVDVLLRTHVQRGRRRQHGVGRVLLGGDGREATGGQALLLRDRQVLLEAGVHRTPLLSGALTIRSTPIAGDCKPALSGGRPLG